MTCCGRAVCLDLLNEYYYIIIIIDIIYSNVGKFAERAKLTQAKHNYNPPGKFLGDLNKCTNVHLFPDILLQHLMQSVSHKRKCVIHQNAGR